MKTYNSSQTAEAKEIAKVIAKTGESVRGISKMVGRSKSYVHFLVTKVLPTVDMALFEEVDKVLQHNKAVRHIRGGESTKRTWEARKQCSINA